MRFPNGNEHELQAIHDRARREDEELTTAQRQLDQRASGAVNRERRERRSFYNFLVITISCHYVSSYHGFLKLDFHSVQSVMSGWYDRCVGFRLSCGMLSGWYGSLIYSTSSQLQSCCLF